MVERASGAPPHEKTLSMGLRWTTSANRDLVRLHDFLAAVNPRAAAKAVDVVLAGVKRIARHPRLGRIVSRYAPRDVRALVCGDYEIRYELLDREIIVHRIWHAREDR